MDKYSGKTFQKNLKMLREFSNLTQGELGSDLFVARTSVSNYENGTREPTLSRLQQIANYFDVSVSYLIGDDRIEDGVDEFDKNKLILTKYVSKDGFLDVSELSVTNRIALVEYFQYLLMSQRKREALKKKFK